MEIPIVPAHNRLFPKTSLGKHTHNSAPSKFVDRNHPWSIYCRSGQERSAGHPSDEICPPRDGLGTSCRVNRINQDDDPILATPVQWRRARSPPRLEPQQHPPRLLVDQAPSASLPHPLKRNRVEVKMRRRPTAMGRFRVGNRCGTLTNGAPEIRVCIPPQRTILRATSRRIQETVRTSLPPRDRQPWIW